MLRTRAAASVPFVILLAAGAVLPAAPFDPQDKPSPRVLYRAPVQTTRACVRDVPNLVRSDIEAARAIVAKYQLALGDVRYQESRLPKGTILDQTVSPGSQVKCGTAIPVIVSRGPGVTDDVRVPSRGGNGARGGGTSDGPPAGSQTSDGPPTGGTRVTRCPVPNLIERDINQVQPTLRSAAATERQWSIGRVERVESTAAPGTILKQSPQPGTYMVCGSAIDVWVAVPGQSCTVPDLTNRPIAEAQALLQRRKWSIGRVERVESRAPEGTILRQSPAPGVYQKCAPSIDVSIAMPAQSCTVPDLTNQPVAAAQALLQRRKWGIGRVERIESRAPEGTILRQSPAPGVYQNCDPTINVWIAVPKPVIACTVPDFIGQRVERVGQAITAAGLNGGSITQRSSTNQPGIVIAQMPQPGTQVPCGSSVSLQVSSGVPSVRVPSLQGQDPASARRTLEGAALLLGTIDRRPSEQTAGVIVDQLPLTDAEVPRGSAVQVWVSAGPTLVPVPDVRGRDRGAAAKILEASRFHLGEIAERPADAAPGTVVEQQPAAGTPARPETPVRVWVSAPIEVPSVIGRREADAATILANQRLRVGTIETRESKEARGTVIEQRPQPRQQVGANTPVDLVLAKPVLVVVPDLRGTDRRAASAALTGAQLQLGESNARESERTAGTVLDQAPRAGDRVELGTPVQIWLAVPVRVDVPPVVGRAQAEALAVLEGRRLRVGQIETRESPAARGAVIEQRPQAGEKVDVDSAVDLVLATPVKVVVPDLRRTSRDEVGTLLRARGLAVGSIATRMGREVPGQVVDQQPAAGTRVEPGTAIALWIATPLPPEPIVPVVSQLLEVPNLTGKTRDEAATILADRGLALGQATTTPSAASPDTVVAQQPTAASRVAPGTGVNVVLAVASPPQTAAPPPQTAAPPPQTAAPPPQTAAPPPVEPAIPVAPDWRMPLVWVLFGIAFGATAAAIVAKIRPREPRSMPASVTLAPHADPVMEVSLTADGPFTQSELMLRGTPDPGIQTVDGPGPFGMIEVTEAR